jgi:hypothetical protein
MTIEELEELRSDLREVRKAIDRHSPLIQQITASNFLALFSLPFGALVFVFGLGTQYLLGAGGGFAGLPPWWLPAFWAVGLLFLIGGGLLKVIAFSKRAQEIGVGIWAVYGAFFGPESRHMIFATLIALGGATAFALSIGHPWFILSAFTVWYGNYFLHLAGMVRRIEYWASGWLGLLAGTISLFSVEVLPFFWLGICGGGLLLLFSILGLIASRADRVRLAPDMESAE